MFIKPDLSSKKVLDIIWIIQMFIIVIFWQLWYLFCPYCPSLPGRGSSKVVLGSLSTFLTLCNCLYGLCAGVYAFLCTLQCLIMGQGRPQAHGGPTQPQASQVSEPSIPPWLLHSCENRKAAQTTNTQGTGGKTANLWLIDNRIFALLRICSQFFRIAGWIFIFYYFLFCEKCAFRQLQLLLLVLFFPTFLTFFICNM